MLEKDALKAVFAKWKIWLANLLGGAGMLAATYGWFWIPDEKTWHLALSALAALGIAAACIYLLAVTVASKTQSKPCFGKSAMWLAALAAWIGLVEWAGAAAPRQGAWLASFATMAIRKPVSPATLTSVAAFFWHVILWLGILAMVPLLGMAMKDAVQTLRRRRYWIAGVTGVVVGFWLPWRLFLWAPGFEGFRVQVASVAVRLLVAWAVMVTAWLWLLTLAARGGTPVVTSSD